MKKFFTLIAAVALAASVNAQGTYAVQVGDKVNAGDLPLVGRIILVAGVACPSVS